MKISVTQEHIDNGTPEDAACCMVALAIKEQVPDVAYVTVDGTSAEVTIHGEIRSFLLPDDVQGYIYDFDTGTEEGICTVEPFSFELPIDPPTIVRSTTE